MNNSTETTKIEVVLERGMVTSSETLEKIAASTMGLSIMHQVLAGPFFEWKSKLGVSGLL